MTNSTASRGTSRLLDPFQLTSFLLFCGLLIYTHQIHFALFHGILELSSVIFYFISFLIIWNTQSYSINYSIQWIGVSLLFVGILDLAHTINDPASRLMQETPNLSLWLWLSARILQAGSIMLGGAFKNHKPDIHRLFLGYALLSVGLVWALSNWHEKLPSLALANGETTLAYGIGSLLIILLSLLAIYTIRKRPITLSPEVIGLISLSLLFGIISEISSTLFSPQSEIGFLVSNLTKIISAFLLYRMAITLGLITPSEELKSTIEYLNAEILERQQIEDNLKTQLERDETILQTTLDGFCMINPEGIIQEANQTLADITCYTKSELIGMNIRQLRANLDETTFHRQYDEILSRGYGLFETEYKSKSGRIFSVENSVKCFDEGGETFLVTFIRDITHRKKIQADQSKLAIALEQTEEAVMITDDQGIMEYVNPAFERMSGYTAEEAIGQDLNLLKNQHQPTKVYERMWQAVLQGHTWRGGMTTKKKNGNLFEVELVLSPLFHEDRLTHFVALMRDMTQEKKLERQLLQNQKMQAIGTLAGGIAHDFNNLLYGMTLNIKLVKEDLPQDSSSAKFLDQALLASGRAKELIQQILAFSRHKEQELGNIDVIPVIEESLKLLRSTTPKNIDFVTHINLKKAIIQADQTQMQQVMMNLCTNAAHAMKEKGGILQVVVGQTELSPPFTDTHGIQEGSYMKLVISDTGSGIDPKVQERIFEPFFTTKGTGEGSGMGLAMTHGIVQHFKGAILCESSLGRGSSFSCFFPLQAKETPKKVTEPIEEMQTKDVTASILFVDDEEMIAKAGQVILERRGYKVISSSSSEEAWQIFQEKKDEIDLVITDQSMPFMTGDQLARLIHGLKPGCPIILATGYSESMSDEKAKEIGIGAFLLKPVSDKQLHKAIQKLLGEPS